MLQYTLRCSGLANHKSHRAFDDSVVMALSHWWSLWHNLTSFLASLCDFPRQCLNHRLAVTPERDSFVPKLVDEPRCSPCNPGKVSSFFSEPASPTSLCVSFPIRSYQRTHNPLTHGAPLPHHLEHPISCAANSHHVPSHRTCTVICGDDVWSCACSLCLPAVGCPGSRLLLTAALLSSNPVPPSSMSSSPFNSVSSPSLFTQCRTRIGVHDAHHVAVLRFQFAWTCLPRSLLLPSKMV